MEKSISTFMWMYISYYVFLINLHITDKLKSSMKYKKKYLASCSTNLKVIKKIIIIILHKNALKQLKIEKQ